MKMRRCITSSRVCRVIGLTAIAASLLGVAPDAGAETRPNLVENGGFEQGLTAPWGTGQYAQGRPVWWNSAGCKSTATIDSRIMRSGAASLHIVNRSPVRPHVFGTTQQPVRVEPGRQYRITLWARAHGLASNGGVSIVVDPQWNVRPIGLPKGTYDWGHFTGKFSLPGNTAEVRILSQDVGEVWIDDVVLEPEPSGAPQPGPSVAEGERATNPPRRGTVEGAAPVEPPSSSRLVIAPVPPVVRPPEVPVATPPEVPADAPRPGADDGAYGVPLVPESRSSERIAAASGGQVKADDGTVVSFDAQGLSADAKVTVARLKPGEPTSQSVTIYDVSLGGARLLRPAKVTMPINDPARVHGVEDVDVIQFSKSEAQWKPLAVTLAADHRSVSVRAEHFSHLVKIEPDSWSDYFIAAVKAQKQAKPLRVPYYSQDDYGWCWAASLAMLQEYQGMPATVWQVAQTFGAGKTDSAPGTDALEAYLRKRDPRCVVETDWFWRSRSLAGYLMYQLDHGRPVWLGLPYVNHAVLVVGYGMDGVYVHDPSGQLLAYTLGKSVAERAALKGELGAHRIPWGRWNIVATGNFTDAVFLNYIHDADDDGAIEWASTWREQANRFNPVALAVPNRTLVVTSPARGGSGLSVQALTKDQTFVVYHVRPENPHETGANPKNRQVHFFWQGDQPQGHRFEHVGAEIPRDHPADVLCNNDYILNLQPFVSNASDQPASDLYLGVFLDGELIALKDTNLPARRVQKPVTLDDFQGSTVNADTPPDRRGKRPLDLNKHPLTPGEHVLRFELAERSAVVDRELIAFQVAPEMVPGVEVRKLDAETVAISWQPVHEEEMPGTQIVYNIRQRLFGRGEGVALVTVLPGNHECRLKLDQRDRNKEILYSVWAYDAASGLSSLDAHWIAAMPAPPEPARPENSLRLVKITVVSFDTKGKKRGDRLDRVVETTWVPVLVGRGRTLRQVVQEKTEELNRRWPDSAAGNWRKNLPGNYDPRDVSIAVSWTVEAETRVLTPPIKPQDVPPARRKVIPGGGETW